MKTAVSISGLLATTMIIVGSLFKIQHWPGGGPMLVLGGTILSTVFCLLLLIYKITERRDSLDVVEGFAVTTTLSFLTIGMMFKVQHWPGAGVITVFGLSLLAVFCIPVLLVTYWTRKEQFGIMNGVGVAIGIALLAMTLSLNSSKEVLQTFNRQLKSEFAQGHLLKSASREAVLNSVSPENEYLASEIIESTDQILLFITNYQLHLAARTLGLDTTIPVQLETIDWSNGADNYDIPTNVLIGGDEGSIRQDLFSAHMLNVQLSAYRNFLISQANSDGAIDGISWALSTDDVAMQEAYEPWEMAMFYHVPLIGVISYLESLKNNCLTSEMIVLSELPEPYSEPQIKEAAE